MFLTLRNEDTSAHIGQQPEERSEAPPSSLPTRSNVEWFDYTGNGKSRGCGAEDSARRANWLFSAEKEDEVGCFGVKSATAGRGVGVFLRSALADHGCVVVRCLALEQGVEGPNEPHRGLAKGERRWKDHTCNVPVDSANRITF
ncbi:hypothetical protein MHYP_G00244470 [Metynnis hypsauchen]